ncbi:MAG TPA: LptA/OstA family protein [Opitutaceae bacterium]|jgi:lipopolysaccharide export system protein LptA
MRQTLLVSAALALAAAAAPLRLAGAPPPQDTTIDSVTSESQSTDTETTFEFHDHVAVVGNGMTLHCDYLKVIATRTGERSATLGQYSRFKYLLATGHVRIVQEDRVATCGRAEVFPGEDRLVLTENPVVSIPSEGYTAYGPRMILYRGQRRAVIEGTPGQPSHISLPPIKDLGFTPDKDKKPSN